MAIDEQSPDNKELTDPHVHLGPRKYQDIVFLILFLVGVLAHFVITTILISSATAYIPNPRVDFPDRCGSNTYCYWREDLNCPVGQAILRSNGGTQACENPCVVDGYVFYNSRCTVQASLDMPLLEQCLAKEQLNDRRLDWNDEHKMNILEGVEDSAGLIVGIVAFTFTMAALWGYLLQKQSVKVVWGTIGIEITAVLILMVYLLAHRQTEPALGILAMTVLGIAFVVKYRKKITLSAQLIGEACTALRANPTVLGYGVLLKALWILYAFYTFYAIYESKMILHLEELPSQYYRRCQLTQPSWVTISYLFCFLLLGWITSVLNQMRTGVVAGTVSLWFFHKGEESMPLHPVRRAMLWAVTTSLGTHAFSGLLLEFIRVLKQLSKRKILLLFAGPPGWILYCLIHALAKFLEIFTTYATVFHVLTGDSLVRSGKRTLVLMKRHFTMGIVAATVGQNVLIFAAIIISYCITWISFLVLLAYYEQLEDATTLNNSAYSIMLLLGFSLVSLMPKFTTVMLVFFFYNVSNKTIGVESVALILAVVMGLFSNIVLRYMAKMINDALATVFVCYGIGKENAVMTPRVLEISRLISIVVPTSTAADGTTTINPV